MEKSFDGSSLFFGARRIPGLVARLGLTGARFILLVLELVVSVLSIPLVVPLILLKLLGGIYVAFDSLLGADTSLGKKRSVASVGVAQKVELVDPYSGDKTKTTSQVSRRAV